jgi:hypothetical protein
MIIRHMINTPIEMPAINPKEKCSMPATLLLSASSAAGKKTLMNVKLFLMILEINYLAWMISQSRARSRWRRRASASRSNWAS